MPTYIYRCESCGTLVERTLDVDERDAPGRCPRPPGSAVTCPGPLRRLFTTPALRVNMMGRARTIREKGLVELGTERPEDIARDFERQRAADEQRRGLEMEAEAMRMIQELGPEGLYVDGRRPEA